jgi:hypothetical protein
MEPMGVAQDEVVQSAQEEQGGMELVMSQDMLEDLEHPHLP